MVQQILIIHPVKTVLMSRQVKRVKEASATLYDKEDKQHILIERRLPESQEMFE